MDEDSDRSREQGSTMTRLNDLDALARKIRLDLKTAVERLDQTAQAHLDVIDDVRQEIEKRGDGDA